MEQPSAFRIAERSPWLARFLWRFCYVLMGLCLIVVAPVGSRAQPPKDPLDFEVPITVNPPRDRLQAMYEAASLVEREQYTAAAKLLQSVLESPEDYFLEHDLQSTLKEQALAMLSGWPAAGREAYERLYSAEAAILWEQVQRTGNPADWSNLLSHYWLTPAGQAAAGQWAAQRIDAGEAFSAGRYWSQQRESLGDRRQDSTNGLREALAWELAGRSDLRQARLKVLLQEALPNPISLGGKAFAGPEAIEQATNWINEQVDLRQDERSQRTVAMWSSPRGEVTRNAIALPALPVGQPAWSVTLLDEHSEPLLSQASPYRREIVRKSVMELEQRLYEEDRIAIPAALPVVNQQRVVIRTLSGLAAFDFTTGALKWRSVVDASLYRRQWNQLPEQPPTPDQTPTAHPALQHYLRERLYRDSLQGSLACNDQLVFAVESNLEVVVPAPRNVIRGTPEVPDPVNRLVAYDLQTGRLQWELGGPRGDVELPLAGHFFLGAPLVLGDTLYCLAESDSEQRLLQLKLDPETNVPRLVWSQVLVAPDQIVARTLLRRLSGLTPTWAEGLVLCPTGCGMMVAVDPLRKQLAWGFQYPSQEPRPFNPRAMMALRGNLSNPPVPVRPEEEISRWLDASPIYVRGMVLFTPRDAAELICLDAVTGVERWRRPRGSALHVAGVQGDHVIIVGRSSVDAIRLSDGEAVWTVATPAPSGQGVLLPDRYLVPVDGKQIWTIELERGNVVQQSHMEPSLAVGSLVAAGGSLFCVNPTGLTRYTSTTELEATLQKRLLADANDPVALALRGELKLHRGDHANGLQDLRDSLKQRPDPRIASVLALTLLNGLRSDFRRFRGEADEIDRLLLHSPARGEFLRTYAQALLDAGEPVAAFTQYLKLAELPEEDQRLERVTGGWSVRGDRLVQGQVRGLYHVAKPDERKAIDAVFATFQSRQAGEAAGAARERRLLQVFSTLPQSEFVTASVLARSKDLEQSTRLKLARQLARSNRPEHAAQGIAAVAELLVEQQRSAEVDPWLERLMGDLASVRLPAADGDVALTGRELAEKLRAKVLRAKADPTWGDAEIQVERKARVAIGSRDVPVELRGPVPEVWRNWTFEITDAPKTVLTARDPAGKVQWNVDITPATTTNTLQRLGGSAAFHTLFIADDHMVLGLTGRFAVLDLTAGPVPVVRWQGDLMTRGEASGATMLPTWRTDWLPCGRRRILPTVMSEFADATPSGQILGVTDEFVCYTVNGRLIAADIQTGRALWVRLGTPQLVEGSVSKDFVTLLDLSTHQAVVYRAEDGAEQSRSEVSDGGTWLWFEGDLLLSVQTDRTGLVTAKLEGLATQSVLWEQSKLPAGTRFCVSDRRELVRWTPPGQLQKLDLTSGAELWHAKTPGVDEANVLRVERYADLDIVFLGRTALTLDSSRISILDPNHLPFAGHVMGFTANSGAPRWKADVAPIALDQQARPNFPILPFVARQFELPQAANPQALPIAPQMRFTGMFLDKRSGDVLYKATETAQPQQYQLELDGAQPRAVVNLSTWSLEFRAGE